jgi:demethylmenaquinone methyltransferase / 2-methoxy-6-polyprenyl-1,4-benzoquinol methylase
MMTITAPTPAKHSATGAQPEGAIGEHEASARVREMFGNIAPRYDFLNHLLSGHMDRLWRRRVVDRFRDILQREDARALDLCCGTGDLTIALAHGGRAQVIGSDYAHPMLVRAMEKSKKYSPGGSHSQNLAGYVEADALQLPYAENSFDLVTDAFGFRNLANYDRGFAEIFRVLRSGGQIGILEFNEPTGAYFGRVFRFYMKRILPRLGRIISGSKFAYSYLPASVEKFPTPDDLIAKLSAAGFSKPTCELWTGGSVALYRATKP